MNGKAIVFSAPSGAGKTTIVNQLTKRIPSLRFSISATTREPREGEIDGEHYYFLSQEDFLIKKDNGDFLEFEEVFPGCYYGTLKSEVFRIWEAGYHIILDTDVKGGLNIKKMLGEKALAIFISVKDSQVLRERLLNRKTESNKMIQTRVEKALAEMEDQCYFDSIIENDILEKAVSEAEMQITEFIS